MKTIRAGRFFLIAVLALGVLVRSASAQERTDNAIGATMTLAPGTPVQLWFWPWRMGRGVLNTEFYKIPQPVLLQIATGALKDDDAYEAVRARGQLVRSFSLDALKDSDNGARVADIGKYPDGEYAAIVSSGPHSVLTPVNITNIGLVEGDTGSSYVFWAVRLSDFTSAPGPIVYGLQTTKAYRAVRTVNGLGRFEGPINQGTVATASAPDGSVATAVVYANRPSTGQTFIQTDRPLYRQGQHVYVRAIYRDGEIGSLKPANGERTLKVIDQDNTTVYQHRTRLDRFGVLNADFALADTARLGYYRIETDDSAYGSFSVEAYKKPEYEANLQAAHQAVISGQTATFTVRARYFFGRPAANMHVHYMAYPRRIWYYRSPFSRWWPQNDSYQPEVQGDTVTGDDGSAAIAIQTAHMKEAQTLDVSVDLRDASGRTISTQTSVLVVPASFGIAISTDRWFSQPGRAVAVTFETTDYDDGKGISRSLHVTIRKTAWSQRDMRYDEAKPVFEGTVRTGNGKATIPFTPSDAGMYLIAADARDQAGRTASASIGIWVSDEKTNVPGQTAPVVAFSKAQYRPGETLSALVTLPSRNNDVLVTLSTQRIVEARVVHVTGTSAILTFAPPQDAARVAIDVAMPTGDGLTSNSGTADIIPAPRVLNVVLKPDKPKYAPGDRAVFNVHVTGSDGKPVSAQAGVSVVDAALLALQDDTRDIGTLFYGNVRAPYMQASWYTPRMLKTIASVRSSSLVKLGAAADVYNVAAPTAAPEAALLNGPVRSTFADTAFWAGNVVTGADGNAKVAFRWPDNLTTWTAKAIAVDAGPAVGQGAGRALVTKDFLIRLELPRFLRKGDKTTIGAMAHGVSGSSHTRLRLDINADPLESLVAFDHNAMANTSWAYTAQALGDQTFVLRGTDGALRDAMQTTIPIESAGTAEHERAAGTAKTVATERIDLPDGYDAGTMHITLTPSIAAQLVQNVRLLDVYPYYCTEQTMSAALPAVFVDRVLARSHLTQDPDRNTKAVVAHAIARLTQLQHRDGSWGWWENDSGHPFMTAYALYGLTEFRHAGYKVNDALYSRGIDSLVAQLAAANSDTLRFWGGAQRGSEWNTRAYMLFSLANAAPDRVPGDTLSQTQAHVRDLNSYALATLGLALHALNKDVEAHKVLDALNARAVDNATYRYWTGESWHYAWEDDPIETTAYALRLNAALGTDEAMLQRTVAFLRSEQHGSWWFTTKDTAAAIYAIAQTVPNASSEYSPNETVRVSVDGRVVRTIRVTRAILAKNDAEIVVPASALKPGSTVAIERSGTGALYWSSDFTRYAPPWVHVTSDKSRSIFARLFPKQPPLSVTRTYDAGHKGAWRVGDEVKVTVTVRSDEDVQYVAIEDPFPAGVEYQPLQGQTGQDWSGVQFFDDRAVFFADTVYKRWPVTLQYRLRVTTPGRYTAPGPNAYAMYGPPVAAQGDAVTVAVQP